MKLRYVILKAHAEGNDLWLQEGDYANRGEALREAKKRRDEEVRVAGSWADRFFVCALEEV